MQQQTKFPGNEQKKFELEQINTFWQWLKGKSVPQTDSDWASLVQSAALVHREDKPLLTQLLNAGIDYYQNEWRKQHD